MAIKVMLMATEEKKRRVYARMLQSSEAVSLVAYTNVEMDELQKLDHLNPEVILIEYDPTDTEVFSLCERLYFTRPQCVVIMIVEYEEASFLKRIMRSGVRHIIAPPSDEVALIEEIQTVYQAEMQRQSALTQEQPMSTTSTRFVTVFGTKGGVGKTTVAVNLAVKLAAQKKKVALIDLDLFFGDVSVGLNLDPKDTIAELMQDHATFDVDTVKNYMLLHSSGVQVLCAPNSPEYAELVTHHQLEKMLSTVRGYFDYVIIDTPPMLSECTITALEISSLILFVIQLDITTLRNAKITLSVLESLGQKEKVQYVLNGEAEGSVSVADAERILNQRLGSRIPYDRNLAVSALNKGIPFAISTPNAKISLGINELAQKVINYKA